MLLVACHNYERSALRTVQVIKCGEQHKELSTDTRLKLNSLKQSRDYSSSTWSLPFIMYDTYSIHPVTTFTLQLCVGECLNATVVSVSESE